LSRPAVLELAIPTGTASILPPVVIHRPSFLVRQCLEDDIRRSIDYDGLPTSPSAIFPRLLLVSRVSSAREFYRPEDVEELAISDIFSLLTE